MLIYSNIFNSVISTKTDISSSSHLLTVRLRIAVTKCGTAKSRPVLIMQHRHRLHGFAFVSTYVVYCSKSKPIWLILSGNSHDAKFHRNQLLTAPCARMWRRRCEIAVFPLRCLRRSQEVIGLNLA